jgi:hypothetical protein
VAREEEEKKKLRSAWRRQLNDTGRSSKLLKLG